VVGLELADPLPEGLSRVALLIGGQVVLDWRVDSEPPLRLSAGHDLLLGALTPARLRPSLVYHRFRLQFEFGAGWIEAQDGGAMVPEFRKVPVYSDEWEDFFDGQEIQTGHRVTYRSEPTGGTCRASDGETPEVRLRLEPPGQAEPPDGMGDVFVERARLLPSDGPGYVAWLREKYGLVEAGDELFVRSRLRYAGNMAGRLYSL
jgi:hypothetical protein